MPAPQASAATFEEHLSREIGESERLRAALLLRIAAALIVFFGAMYLLFRDTYRQHFSSTAGLAYVLAILGLLACHEYAILRALGRRPPGAAGVPDRLRYLNTLIETSVPSAIILAVASESNPLFVLQSAAVLLYGVFIVLSTLQLDFRLSAFTGLVAAAEYLALCIHFHDGNAADT